MVTALFVIDWKFEEDISDFGLGYNWITIWGLDFLNEVM